MTYLPSPSIVSYIIVYVPLLHLMYVGLYRSYIIDSMIVKSIPYIALSGIYNMNNITYYSYIPTVYGPRYLRAYKLKIWYHSTAAIRVIVTKIG